MISYLQIINYASKSSQTVFPFIFPTKSFIPPSEELNTEGDEGENVHVSRALISSTVVSFM